MPALEKACAVLLFQLLDLEGNSRLSHEQRIGSPRKTQVLGYGMKNLQTPISHDDSPE
jgi:hypothetical protein